MPANILVVDDEPDLELLIRQRFQRQIEQHAYRIAFAGNGVEALANLEADPTFDLILVDLNMPEMDGLTLLGRLPALNPVLKAIVITAYGDMANIRAAMHQGAYDFLTKPLDLNDLEATIERGLAHVQQHLRYIARLTAAAAAVEAGAFDPASLDDIAQSRGELSHLARVFQQMAGEVRAREHRLQEQVQELRIVIDQRHKAQQVQEVTENAYFRRLQQTAKALRARAVALRDAPRTDSDER